MLKSFLTLVEFMLCYSAYDHDIASEPTC